MRGSHRIPDDSTARALPVRRTRPEAYLSQVEIGGGKRIFRHLSFYCSEMQHAQTGGAC
jgi:hypothetical protein